MSENGNKPKFDFTKVSRQWNRDWARSLAQALRAQVVVQREPNDDMSDAEVDALRDKQDQALVEFEVIADQQAELLVKVLADVPSEWLLPNAPDHPDWSKVESLDYIQADRYMEILDLLRTRDVAGEDSKNSDGHSRSRQKRRGR